MDEQVPLGSNTEVAQEGTPAKTDHGTNLPSGGPPNAVREPIEVLALALGIKLPLPPAYGVWRFTLWAAPCSLLVLVGLCLPSDTAKTLIFTLAGAFASIQLAKPYQLVETRVTEMLIEMEDQKRSLPQNLKSYFRFFFSQPRMFVVRKDGTYFKSATNARYALARLRYRRLAERWDKSFGERTTITRAHPDDPYWAIDERKIQTPRGIRRASKTLTKVGRELRRITGNPDADECVKTAARRYKLEYARYPASRVY